MEEIATVVTSYLNDTLANYAVMINGRWGVGKTYHWQNTIRPMIERHNFANPPHKLKPAYVSLFGPTNSEDIDRAIFLALYPVLSGKAAKAAQATSRIVLPGVKLLSKHFIGFTPTFLRPSLKLAIGSSWMMWCYVSMTWSERPSQYVK